MDNNDSLIGKKFHNLTVIDFAYKKNNAKYWLCKCDCGNEKIIQQCHLTSGATHSCGCKKKKQIESMNKERTKHGKRYTRLYKIWCNMKGRCENPKADNYKYYGARGIKVCDIWEKNFENFYNWSIKNGYEENLTIDRIDVNGNYCPENCAWKTIKEQENNRRNNRVLMFNGIEKNVTEWSEELGINRETIYKRLRSGWSIEKTLTTPVNKSKATKIKNN